jgi:hypothetical protein
MKLVVGTRIARLVAGLILGAAALVAVGTSVSAPAAPSYHLTGYDTSPG